MHGYQPHEEHDREQRRKTFVKNGQNSPSSLMPRSKRTKYPATLKERTEVRSRAEQLAGAKKMRQLAQKARTQERREYLLKLAALGSALARVNPDQSLPQEAERPCTEAGEQHVIPGAECLGIVRPAVGSD